MTGDGNLFQFGAAPSSDANAIVIRVPAGLRSKEKLLGVYAERLRFPFYFGWNWDAFEECLRDLSWLPDASSIVVLHADVPFGGGENRPLYLAILSDWICSSGGRVRVGFPAESESEVRAATDLC